MKPKKINQKIFNSIVDICKEFTDNTNKKKSPDYLAKKISVRVSEELLSKQQKKIYKTLTSNAAPVSMIAKKCKIESKHVSAQLQQMQQRTNLISFKKEGKNKLWHRSTLVSS